MSTGSGCTDAGTAMANFVSAVAGYCRSNDLLPATGLVAVAFSGGPDSTALLHALARISPGGVHAVHVDHGLEAESAVMAGAAVDLAEGCGAPVEVVSASVDAALVRAKGVEAAAREARYGVLARVTERIGATACALGHTADDRAETVLMNLMRGSGLAGFATMRPRRGMYVRPLLALRRADTEAYCAATGLVPVEDPSNADPRIWRNRVRAELLPLLESLRPGAVGRIADAAGRLEADADLLDALAAAEAESCVRSGATHVVFDVDTLGRLPRAVGVRVVRAALAPLLDGAMAPAAATEAVLAGRAGPMRGTPLDARLDPDGFVVRHPGGGADPVVLPLRGAAVVGGCRVEVRACPDGVVLSARRLAAGDRVSGASRTLRDTLARQGVPRRVRDESLTILADGAVAGAAVPGHGWVGSEGIDVRVASGRGDPIHLG